MVCEIPNGVQQPGGPDKTVVAQAVVRTGRHDRGESELPDAEAAIQVAPAPAIMTALNFCRAGSLNSELRVM